VSAILQPLGTETPDLKLEYFHKVRSERRPVVIPLRVNFLSSGKTAHVCTLDVSPTGARIHTAGHDFQPGDEILLQWRVERARARVVWVGEGFHRRSQIGIECLEVERVFWKEERIAQPQEPAPKIKHRFRR
jgi:hypothetical protein